MITKEIINKMCHKYVSTNELTTEDLIRYGLVQEEINQLLEQKIITLTETNGYEIISPDAIYLYGIEKINNGNIYQGLNCFEKCYELNPKHKDVNLQLLLFYFNAQKYTKVYEIIDSLYSINNERVEKATNLYLYLLSLIIDTPERYEDKLTNMTKEDLFQTNESVQNDIICKILLGKYLPAIKQINILSSNTITLENKVIKKILSKIVIFEQELSDEILKLSTQERYHDIEMILSKRKNTIINQYVLKLTKIIQNIIKTQELPTISSLDAKDVFEAIECNDFELALRYNKEYQDKYNLKNDNAIKILLIKINKLVESIKKQQEESKEAVSEEISNVESNKIQEKNINISELILTLLENNIDEFSQSLKLYLKEIQQETYEYLIVNLVKLSLIEKDNAYIKPITILTELSTNNYKFDISSYLQTFYLYLSQNKLLESRIILDIITRYYHNSTKVIDNLNSSLIQKEKQQEEQVKTQNFAKEEIENVVSKTNPETEETKELIVRTIYTMKQNGEFITLLPSIPYKTRIIIHSLIQDIDDIKVFSVGKEPKTMVLRIIKNTKKK